MSKVTEFALLAAISIAVSLPAHAAGWEEYGATSRMHTSHTLYPGKLFWYGAVNGCGNTGYVMEAGHPDYKIVASMLMLAISTNKRTRAYTLSCSPGSNAAVTTGLQIE